MIKYILLTSFIILVVPTQVFAKRCAIVLSHPNIKRIEGLSNEGQDIMLIASLIASQLQLDKSPLQINPTLILLAAITEIETDNKNENTFQNFNSTDRTLFTILKHLEILEKTQIFLLNQLGFNDHYLGPFSTRPDGGVTLHLNSSPATSITNYFNYDETTSMLLDKINGLNQTRTTQSKQRRSAHSLPIFSKQFLLAVLELDIPLRTFLFDVLNTRDTKEIKSIFDLLFDDIKQTAKPSNEFLDQLIKNNIVQEVIPLIKKSVSIAKVAEGIGMSRFTLWKWINEYEQENGPIPGRQQKTPTAYSREEKTEFIQKAIQLFKEKSMSASEAARRLKIKAPTLTKWLNEYEEKNGQIPGRQRKLLVYHSEIEREEITQKAIPLLQKGITITKSAKILNVGNEPLQRYINKHEEKYGIIKGRRRNTSTAYSQEKREQVIQETIKLLREETHISVAEAERRLKITHPTLRKWLNEYEKEHGPIFGRLRQAHISHSQKKREQVIQETIQLFQKEKKMTIAKAARKLKITYPTLRRWINEHEQKHGPIEGRHQWTGQFYSQKKIDEIIKKTIQFFQEKDMTIAEAARRLDLKYATLWQWLEQYEEENGPINGRRNRYKREPIYPQEEKR